MICLSWLARGWVGELPVLDDGEEDGEGGNRECDEKPRVWRSF